MKKLFCATILAACAAASVAHAEQPLYVGAAVGLTGGEANILVYDMMLSNTNDPMPYRLNVGYNITPRFAVEAGYLNSGEFKFNGAPRLEMSVLSLAAKGILPINAKWSLNGKLGVARHSLEVSGLGANSISENDTSAMLGVGSAYHFTPQVAMTLDLVNYGTNNKNGNVMRARQIELGLQYNF